MNVCVCYLVGATGESVCVAISFFYSCQVKLHLLNFHNADVRSLVLSTEAEQEQNLLFKRQTRLIQCGRVSDVVGYVGARFLLSCQLQDKHEKPSK